MSRIIELEINNYRCIKKFKQQFTKGNDFICFVGRGDSGKTTILNAINSVLNPAWNMQFYDTDFHNCNINEPIEIVASLDEIPDSLLTEGKYGLFHRTLDSSGQISDNVKDGDKEILTIKLTVDKTLEPKWTVTTTRQMEDKEITANDRARLNCFMVSDEIDRHFSWGKGTPLFSLSRKNDDSIEQEHICKVNDVIRGVKDSVNNDGYECFSETTDIIRKKIASFGLNIADVKTGIDLRDFYIREGRLSLLQGKIPFKLKGKGSKRLISIGIQSAIVDDGGIMLIDEIEQGLEPDRIKQLVRTLKDEHKGQIIVSTHSRDVITELQSKHLRIVCNKNSCIEFGNLDCDNDKLKATVRACPEAFFAKKVIVCEGATEVGICRALDTYRKDVGKELLCYKDCVYIDGNGAGNSGRRASELLGAGFKTCVLCDSDSELTPSKEELKKQGLTIYDCESDKNIEGQVFDDLPWNGITELLQYALATRYQNDFNSLIQALGLKNGYTNINDLSDKDDIRLKIAKASVIENDKSKGWFKRIDHGEYLGTIIFKYLENIQNKHLGKTMQNLLDWVDS